jgi:Mg2+/Co2+ transporter CorB
VPRQEIVGIDLDADWSSNLDQLTSTELNRMPVYRDDIDSIVGVVSVRPLLPSIANGTLNEHKLTQHLREPYFVPEGTPLTQQLLSFKEQHRRTALVVDEYGDVQGLVSSEDILREIVGEFGASAPEAELSVKEDGENRYVVDASSNIRQLNRLMHWRLPTDGPKTLNGLILEQLETIPEPATNVTVSDYLIEILSTSEHAITSVRIHTALATGDIGLQVAES